MFLAYPFQVITEIPSPCITKHTMVVPSALLLPLLLLCYGVGNIHCSPVHRSSIDLHSLLDFKQGITSDPNEALKSWNTSNHYCKWTGVTCTQTRPWRVSGLNLTDLSLGGQISSSLGNLTFLNYLDLSYNNFFGPLPLLNRLQQLKNLILGSNSLHGAIPDSLTNISSLSYLDLSTNLLVGAIPANISLLSNLDYLDLDQNNLTGTIPQTIGDITSLEMLFLFQNQLSGSIPDKIWQLPNLVRLSLGVNNLSGGIPQTLHNLSSLQILGLEYNMLSKALPPNIGDALSNLEVLNLGNNMFEGQIPASLGNASGLQTIDLLENKFVGKIPPLGKLINLTYLGLGRNRLKASDGDGWEFLHALGNCSSLQKFSVGENQLEGHIPNSIGNLSTNLQYLILSGNKLSGIVPPSIGNLQSLTWLALDFNNLTGPIDEWIGKLTNLVRLNLCENNFTGPIPPSIGNLNQLVVLYLGTNGFTGLIPPSFGNLQYLAKLDVSFNNLHGSIPKELFSVATMIVCALTHNNLDGPIIIESGNLRQLTELHLSSNRITGHIPDNLGQFQEIETIRMDQNFLAGTIPISLSNLKSLSILNLSHNNLSGTIPMALDNLQFLTQLDLSDNNLKGEVPTNGVFKNSTAISLNNNCGLCGGLPDLHMPPCYTVSRRKQIQYHLVRVLIPVFGIISFLLLIHFLLPERKKSSGKYLSRLSFGKNFPKISYNDLTRATSGFSESNLIGRGSYGSVYKGKIAQAKMQVAIKVFDLEMRCADKCFISECDVLRSIQHRNLLPILTACSTIDNIGNAFKALVYEFMPNGNLDTWLHEQSICEAPRNLSLGQRISIIVDIADALAYLHHDSGRSIVHCDIKPSNILLDVHMNAYLSDFGIANIVLNSGSTSVGHSNLDSSFNSSIGLKGTIGYIAPGNVHCHIL